MPLLWLGCHVEYDVPREPPDAGEHYTVPDAWKKVREDMVKAKACFAERRPYCLTDRDLLDRAIQLDLDTHFHGRMPLNARWVDELTGRSRAHWNEDMKTQHVRRVEERVAAHWEKPWRDKQKGRADIQLFVPPGTLTVEKGDWRIDSDLVVGHELASTELAKQLSRYREQYPKMPVVRLLIDIPIQRGLGFRRWDVRHQLASQQILLVDPLDPIGAWVTEPLGPLGFTPYLEGDRSLSIQDLSRCALAETMAEAPDCTVSPPYRPTKQRRQAVRGPNAPRPGWTPQGDAP